MGPAEGPSCLPGGDCVSTHLVMGAFGECSVKVVAAHTLAPRDEFVLGEKGASITDCCAKVAL